MELTFRIQIQRMADRLSPSQPTWLLSAHAALILYTKTEKIQLIPLYQKNKKEKQKDLRNIVYKTMQERSKNSNVEYIKYVKQM